MKRLAASILITFLCFILNSIQAQDTLPRFNIRDINDKKILITWINPYEYNCTQLAVQRSFDSTNYFTTIYSAISPELPQNGVIDMRMPKGVDVYYRIFYVLEGGKYFFSKSMGVHTSSAINASPITSISPKRNSQREIGNVINPDVYNITETIEKVWINVFRRSKDTLLFQIDQKNLRHFRDSIITKTKDTINTIDATNIIINTFVPKPLWKPSQFVFATESTNKVTMRLPSPKLHKYRIVFYDEDGSELFQIKQPKDAELIIDNSNFIHGGWFSFDLFEDDKLKEHNKFQLLIPF